MFSRLRLYGFLGGNHQQHQIDASSTSQHVAHKSFMSWHINESKPDPCVFQKSKTQINSDAAAFFFGKPIRIRPSESFHQRRFTVVYMACRADDHAFEMCRHKK